MRPFGAFARNLGGTDRWRTGHLSTIRCELGNNVFEKAQLASPDGKYCESSMRGMIATTKKCNITVRVAEHP